MKKPLHSGAEEEGAGGEGLLAGQHIHQTEENNHEGTKEVDYDRAHSN